MFDTPIRLSHIYTTIEKPKELSIDLKEGIIDLYKSAMSLGAISKQFVGIVASCQKPVCFYLELGYVGWDRLPYKSALMV